VKTVQATWEDVTFCTIVSEQVELRLAQADRCTLERLIVELRTDHLVRVGNVPPQQSVIQVNPVKADSWILQEAVTNLLVQHK
jgi:hypothetical protein